MRRIKLNKRGQMNGVLYFFVGLFIALFLGFMGSVLIAFIDWSADNTLAEFPTLTKGSDKGGIGNLTKSTDFVTTPLDRFIQAIPGVIGAMYVMTLVGVLGLAYAFRTTEQKWLLGLFFVLTLALVVSAIGISIVYEDFYDDSGDFGDRLKEQTLMSFLVLYSPAIFTMIAVVGAMIMFTGGGQEGI